MDEEKFQSEIRETEWFKEFTQEYGEEPNLDDPDYDYRAAWAAGVRPERYEHDGGKFHWPSNTPDGKPLKSENHPTKWMEDFMQKTGKDPNELGIKSKEEGEKYLNSEPFIDKITRSLPTNIIAFIRGMTGEKSSIDKNYSADEEITSLRTIIQKFRDRQKEPSARERADSSPEKSTRTETIHPRESAGLDESKFYSQLAKHEGFSAKVYKDSEGFDTIGFGHKVKPGEDWSKGITKEEAMLLLQQDAAEAIGYARTLPYWEQLNAMQKNVIAEMIFNLGFNGFKKFKKTNQLLEQGKFEEASKEMLKSKWAKQVKGRALTLSKQLKGD